MEHPAATTDPTDLEASNDQDRTRLRFDPAARKMLAAAFFYMAVALWSVRVIIPAPTSLFPYPENWVNSAWDEIERVDQQMVAWLIARNARTLLTAPGDLLDSEQCYPMPRALTLGEHMLGSSVLGIPSYLLSRDPVLTYNSVVLLTLWLGAICTYIPVYYFTGSAGAALVAGLIAGFHPGRVGDPVHPFVFAYQWTPMALMFAHRLFSTGRWIDLALLALFVTLQMLESFYALMVFALFAGGYGTFLVLRHRRRLPSLAAKLAVLAVGMTGVAALILLPYLRTRALWGTLRANHQWLHAPADFAPGSRTYPGSVLLALATVALIDRLRRARVDRGYDPRLLYLAGGVLCFWSCITGLTIPGLGITIPSLYSILRRVLPGADAVRAPGDLHFGVYLALAFLAGYGVLALTAGRRPAFRRTLVAVAVAAVLVELFYPPLSRLSFGISLEMIPVQSRPPDDLIELYTERPEGAVLDLPFVGGIGNIIMIHGLWPSAFHRRPVAVCYNSFFPAVTWEVSQLVDRLPANPAASINALYAVGFRTLMIHDDLFNDPSEANAYRGSFAPMQALPRQGPHLSAARRAGQHTAYQLENPLPMIASFEALEVQGDSGELLEVEPPEATIDLTFEDTSSATYRHPDPIEPTRVMIRWIDAKGEIASEHSMRLLLPLALMAGESTVRKAHVPVPRTPGDYIVTLSPADTPETTVARRRVRVQRSGDAS